MLHSEPTLPIEAVLPTLPKLLVGQPQRSGLLQDAVFESVGIENLVSARSDASSVYCDTATLFVS